MKKVLITLAVLLLATTRIQAQTTKPSTNGTDNPKIKPANVRQDTVPQSGRGNKSEKMRRSDSTMLEPRMKNSGSQPGNGRDTTGINRANGSSDKRGSKKTDPNGTGAGRTDPPPAPNGTPVNDQNGSKTNDGTNNSPNGTSTGTGSSKPNGTAPGSTRPDK